MTLPEALDKAQALARQHYKRAAVVVLRNPETDCIEVHVISEEN